MLGRHHPAEQMDWPWGAKTCSLRQRPILPHQVGFGVCCFAALGLKCVVTLAWLGVWLASPGFVRLIGHPAVQGSSTKVFSYRLRTFSLNPFCSQDCGRSVTRLSLFRYPSWVAMAAFAASMEGSAWTEEEQVTFEQQWTEDYFQNFEREVQGLRAYMREAEKKCPSLIPKEGWFLPDTTLFWNGDVAPQDQDDYLPASQAPDQPVPLPASQDQDYLPASQAQDQPLPLSVPQAQDQPVLLPLMPPPPRHLRRGRPNTPVPVDNTCKYAKNEESCGVERA